MAINVNQPEINLPINTGTKEKKENVITPVILEFNENEPRARDRWVFRGSGSLEEKEKDFKNFIDNSVINGKEIPSNITDFISQDALKDMVRGDPKKSTAYRKWYHDNLERYGVKDYAELNEQIKSGEAAKKLKKDSADTLEEETRVELATKGSAPARTTVEKTEDGSTKTVLAAPTAKAEDIEKKAEEVQEIINEPKQEVEELIDKPIEEEKKTEEIIEDDLSPIKEVETIFEANGINIYSDDFNSPDSEVKLQSIYENSSKKERKTIDKAMNNMAPTIKKAWKATKDKNDSRFVKFFKNWINRAFSDDVKREEWLRKNPNPISAIFGDSGLNAGQRIGLFMGLASAIAADFLRGYSDGFNHRPNSGSPTTDRFMSPFNEIQKKNIERIVGLKDASNTSEKLMEEKVSAYKQDNRLNILPRSTLASLISFFENPDNKFTEETMAEYEDEFRKVYEQNFGSISADTLADYNAWKARTLKHFISKQGINPERLENAGKFLDLAIKENELAQQVHNFEFSSINDYNNAIVQLRTELLGLEKLRSEAVTSDTSKLLDIAGKYRNVVAGLSTTTGAEGETASKGSTTGSSSDVGGTIAGDVGIKMVAKVNASAHGNYGKSETETETSGTNRNTATYKDAANDDVYAWLNDGKIKGDLGEAKNTLIKAIDAQIEAVQSTIKEMEMMKNKIVPGKRVSFDGKLSNLYETGFYEKPKIKNDNYYKYRLGLI